jgi:hypothetical protein
VWLERRRRFEVTRRRVPSVVFVKGLLRRQHTPLFDQVGEPRERVLLVQGALRRRLLRGRSERGE